MKFTPLRISVIYLIFAVIWITTTDQLLEWMIEDVEALSRAQTYKGIIFVLGTAFGLFWMMKSYETSISKNERELDKERSRLNLALNAAKMGVWQYDPVDDRYSVSDDHNILFGYERVQDLKLEDVYQVIHPDDLSRFKTKVHYTLENGEDFDIRYRVRTRDGQERWLWTKGEVISENGEARSVTGVTVDITHRKKLEEKLSFEQERFKKLFDKIPVLIDMFDPELNVTRVNRHFEEVLGWTNEDLQENNLLELCYPDPEYRKNVEKQMRERKGKWQEYTLKTRDGGVRHQLWTNIVLSDDTIVGIGYDITERKELQNQVLKEREELQAIIDAMPVFVALQDEKSNVIQVNRFFEQRLGYSNEFVRQNNLLKRLISDKDYHAAMRHIIESDGTWEDFELIAEDGERLQSTWTNVRLGPEKALGIGVDITPRKEMERRLKENEQRLHLTTSSANVGLWEWYPQTGETNFDEIWADLVGYTLEELEPVSIQTWNKLVHPEDYPKFEKAVDDYFFGRTPTYECEIRMRHKEGHWVWILDRGRAVEWDEEGNPTRLVGTHIDISDRIAYEESLRYQASLMANVSDAIIAMDSEQCVVTWNAAAEELYGWTQQEVKGKKASNVIKTEYPKDVSRNDVLTALSEKGSWQGEMIHFTKEGDRRNVFCSVTVIKDGDGEIADIVSVNRDITERKKYEQENLLLANVFINSNTALSVSNHLTNHLERVNHAYAELFGYTEEELVKLDVHDLYADPAELNLDQKISELDEAGFVSFEARMKRKDGTEFDGIINLSVVKENVIGDPYRISTVQDISELKRVQQQLVLERQRFELAANNVSDVVWEWNPVDRELWWGEGLETVMGYQREEYEGELDFWITHIHEDDRDRIRNSMDEAIASGAEHWEEEYRFQAADGNWRHVSDSAVLIRDESGELLKSIGAMVDVTRELEYQQALQQERNRLELIARTSNDVLYDYDQKTGEVWWSEGWQTRFQYQPDEVEAKHGWWQKKVHPEDKDRVENSIRESIENREEYWSDKYRFQNGKGEYRIVTDKGFFVSDESGEPERLVGTITDITSEEMAKEELKRSEEQYRLLFLQSPLPMYIYDTETLQIIVANNSALEKYGYSKEELKEMEIYRLHPEHEWDDIREEIAEDTKVKKTGFDIRTQLTKTGEKIIAEISGSEIFYEGKRHRLIIANDVTEQKKAEERAISAIVEGEERERRRIAKELHDGLGQYLTAANMNFESIQEKINELPHHYSSTFNNGMGMLNYAISETRSISQNLLPKAIQDYGLELGLEALINQLRGNSSINFYLYQNLKDVEIPDNIQINLYRVVQEAINNAIRHGKPDNINVQLIYSKNEILLTIEDDGIGFDADKISETGLGLRSMKTRVGAMSANIDIVSTKGRGTIISVAVPL